MKHGVEVRENPIQNLCFRCVSYLKLVSTSYITNINHLVVQISCEMDTQFAGMVEAWAVGVTWKELTTDCGMDEGDVARLLRRSIDLLAQV